MTTVRNCLNSYHSGDTVNSLLWQRTSKGPNEWTDEPTYFSVHRDAENLVLFSFLASVIGQEEMENQAQTVLHIHN